MRTLNRKGQQGAPGGYINAILVSGGLLTMGSRLGSLYMDDEVRIPMVTNLDLIASLRKEVGLRD